MIAEFGWKCDICRKEYSSEDTPATDCDISSVPVEVFQERFPGHRPKKGRNTIICYECSSDVDGRSML